MAKVAKADQPLAPGANETVLQVLKAYRDQAANGKITRKRKSEQNVGAYLGQWDWSHKQRGQSREATPKIAMAAEQMSAFVKRALVQFGDYFSVELPDNAPIRPESVVKLLRCELDHLPLGSGFDQTSFAVVLGDSIKSALFESLVTMKVHGGPVKERDLFVEKGNVSITTRDGPWRLRVEGIRQDDYFPDPTGRGLYKIHSVERDLHDVFEMAEQGAYDIEQVKLIEEDFEQQEEKARKHRKKNQDDEGSMKVRRRVVLDEMWGTLVNEGRVVKQNIITTMANKKWLIREPVANPWWHQEDPFIDAPLIRVPGSVWHKALYDDAVGLNKAINEMLNLIIDGGLSAVCGFKQIRTDWLKNPGDTSAGIPPGFTADVSGDAPASAEVLKFIKGGGVPQDAIQTLGILFREFNAATLENEITLGQLPGKKVLATEILQAGESQAVTLDSVSSDVEREVVEAVLRKSWLMLLQNIGRVSVTHLKQAMSNREIIALLRMPPRERFLTLGSGCIFKVHGLSATLARARDFQKLMALLSVVGQNPILLQSFVKEYAPSKVIRQMMKMLNINPETIRRGSEEQQGLAEELAFAARIQALANPNPPQQGSDRTEAQIQQEAQPQQV